MHLKLFQFRDERNLHTITIHHINKHLFGVSIPVVILLGKSGGLNQYLKDGKLAVWSQNTGGEVVIFSTIKQR